MRKKRIDFRSIIIGLVCLSALIAVSVIYMTNLNDRIKDDSKENLLEISEKNALAIRSGIQSNFDVLNTLAAYIESDDIDNKEAIIEKLKKVAQRYDYKRIGIADVDGSCLTSDNVTLSISHREYYQASLKGKEHVALLHDIIGENGDKIMVYSVPLYHEKTIAGVLFIVKDTNEVANNLLVNSFHGHGYSLLADDKGKIILQQTDKKELPDISYLDQLTHKGAKAIQKDTEAQKGVISFDYQNKSQLMAYQPLFVNDWYVVSIVPSSVITQQIASFTGMAFLTWLGIIGVFTVLIGYIYYSYHKTNKKMENILFKDNLTEFDNFNRFKLDVQEFLNNRKQEPCTLIEFDINDFKMFNKIHGYVNGDILLKYITRHANANCEKGECCARIGEDRFVVCCLEDDREIIIKRINTFYTTLSRVFHQEYPGMEFQLCFGVYIIPFGDCNLMKCLDKAIYAKNHIKYNHDTYISFYDEQMYELILREKQMEERMVKALEDREFVVYLQPKVDVKTFEIVAAEALIRWIDPVKGMISPGEFIPLFERNGFLEKLDMFVFETICSTLAKWQKEHKNMICISVNISKSYMFVEGFAQRLKTILDHYELSARYIELEITESVIFENSVSLVAIIKELKSYGFTISMDDFGSGYSSLNMLKEVPIDVIKLDQVFFRNSEENKNKSDLIIEGLLDMIRLLHIDTVAEGIETEEQIQFLKRVQCHIAQGFYFYRPMPIKKLEAILNDE